MFASEHTRLVNRFIGLCKDTIKWPNILHQLGYSVELIEQTINLKNAAKVHPDIVAFSQKHLHAIVADCKSGKNIDTDQDSRYTKLESDDLKYFITTYDPKRLKHVVCYVDTDHNHDSLKSFTKLSFVTFGDEVVQGERDFGYDELNKSLCRPISLNKMLEPTSYYPFSPDDDQSVIAPHILRGLISYLTHKGQKIRPQIKSPTTAVEILKIIHPYDIMSSKHKDQLIKTIEDVLQIFLNSNKEFNDQVTKIEKGEFNIATFRSLVKICEDMIKEFESQKKITDVF